MVILKMKKLIVDIPVNNLVHIKQWHLIYILFLCKMMSHGFDKLFKLCLVRMLSNWLLEVDCENVLFITPITKKIAS